MGQQITSKPDFEFLFRRSMLVENGLPWSDPAATPLLQAYVRGDRGHFLVPDEDAASLGRKFVVHMLWYSHSRIMFTADFIKDLLQIGRAHV